MRPRSRHRSGTAAAGAPAAEHAERGRVGRATGILRGCEGPRLLRRRCGPSRRYPPCTHPPPRLVRQRFLLRVLGHPQHHVTLEGVPARGGVCVCARAPRRRRGPVPRRPPRLQWRSSPVLLRPGGARRAGLGGGAAEATQASLSGGRHAGTRDLARCPSAHPASLNDDVAWLPRTWCSARAAAAPCTARGSPEPSMVLASRDRPSTRAIIRCGCGDPGPSSDA